MQRLLHSFSSKVFNCRLCVDLLPSLESNEGKAEGLIYITLFTLHYIIPSVFDEIFTDKYFSLLS